MKRILRVLLLLFPIIISCNKIQVKSFKSDWDKSPDGVWVGPDFWANRLQDWAVVNGKLECRSTRPMRTVHLVTRRISDTKGNLNSSVKIFLNDPENASDGAAAGFLVGAGRGLDIKAASLVFHSWGESAGLFVGLDIKGNLFIRDFEKENYYFIYNKKNEVKWTEAKLSLSIFPNESSYTFKVLAINPFTNILIDEIEFEGITGERVNGNIALVSHAGYGKGAGPGAHYSFSGWRVSGSKLVKIADGNIGPIVAAQYTLSRNRLKLTSQLMPIGDNETTTVQMQIMQEGKWTDFASAKVTTPSYTAKFSADNWNTNQDVDYRLVYKLKRNGTKSYYLNGRIKHDPADKEEIRMLSLSCVEQIIKPDRRKWAGTDGGYFPYDKAILYPHLKLVNNLKKYNADILFFAGDQVYEGASPTSADLENPKLDYLYKWYLWCLTYRDLTKCIPTITIPDDHDVYHGNLWGAGGKATPAGLVGAAAQDAGGYKMSPEFVNMVQETQTSHLPDPFDPAPADQGISVYFTECNIGGVSMAVLEDRKFKPAPRGLLPQADIYNGWPRNKYWSARYSSRIENTDLLGARQIVFLEKWAEDWSGQVWMKVALSQTLFANLATIPRDSMTDDVVPLMEIPDSGSYVEGDKLATDFDSDAWPQNGRDKAIRLFRKAFAIHVAGDQHLGSTVQYGVDQFRDAGFAIISPATGNIWPRHWFPPNEGWNRKPEWPRNFGDFEDSFGNKITVFAVANPHKSTIQPTRHNELSTGYSVITFNRSTRNIELANWPYYADPETDKPFPFWPVKINQQDNYGRQAVGWLPEIKVEGIDKPVIKVIREYTGEVIYSLRISGKAFQPKVFEMGNYRVEVGEPDRNQWQKIEKLYPTEFKEREPVKVRF